MTLGWIWIQRHRRICDFRAVCDLHVIFDLHG